MKRTSSAPATVCSMNVRFREFCNKCSKVVSRVVDVRQTRERRLQNFRACQAENKVNEKVRTAFDLSTRCIFGLPCCEQRHASITTSVGVNDSVVSCIGVCATDCIIHRARKTKSQQKPAYTFTRDATWIENTVRTTGFFSEDFSLLGDVATCQSIIQENSRRNGPQERRVFHLI